MLHKFQVTIVTRQQGQVLDQLFDSILDDIFNAHGPNSKPQKQILDQTHQTKTSVHPALSIPHLQIPYHYISSYDLHHATCYKQFVGNFCGYHSHLNTLIFLQMLMKPNDDNRYSITSAASFWKFKNSIEKYLFAYRQKYSNKPAEKEEWPWRDRDILFGDFERTYHKLLKGLLVPQKNQNDNCEIQFMEHTWQFQYKNIILTEDSRQDLEQKIKYFANFKKKNTMLVFSIMLAITNHWTCFIAVKIDSKSQFWFFDSKNLDYLQFTQSQIDSYVFERQPFEKPNKNQKEKKMSLWHEQVSRQAMKDTQTSLQLLVKCLKGQQTLYLYHYNRRFQVFAEPFVSNIVDHMYVLSNDEVAKLVIDWWHSCKHDVRQFFGRMFNKDVLMHERNQRNLSRIKDILSQCCARGARRQLAPVYQLIMKANL